MGFIYNVDARKAMRRRRRSIFRLFFPLRSRSAMWTPQFHRVYKAMASHRSRDATVRRKVLSWGMPGTMPKSTDTIISRVTQTRPLVK